MPRNRRPPNVKDLGLYLSYPVLADGANTIQSWDYLLHADEESNF
jgi:hypothetical protein